MRIEPIARTAPNGRTVRGVRLGPVDMFFGERSGKFPDGNQVIVRGRDSMVAFDTPMVANLIAPEIQAADLLVLSHVHEDHTAGLHLIPHLPVHSPRADVDALRSLKGLAQHYGYGPGVSEAMVARAQADFHFQPRPDAACYEDGAVWDLGNVRVRAIHMPGHTRGHSVLLVEPWDIAFIGDIDLSSFGPYYGDACSDLPAFRRTLRQIQQVPAQVWITSHHKGLISDKDTFLALLRDFAAVIDRRDQALLSALSSTSKTLDELACHRFVYPQNFADLFVPAVERRVISQHLDQLLAQGLIRRDGNHYTAS